MVLLPARNENGGIRPVLSGIPNSVLHAAVDVVVIDDGSTDGSGEIARSCGAIVIRNEVPQGYGRAVRAGFAYALENGYDFCIKLDADGQHDTRYVSTVAKILLRGGVDYVLSSRYLRSIDAVSTPPLDRRLLNTMMTGAINSITRRGFTDVFCGFFGLTRHALQTIAPELSTDGYGLELEMIVRTHARGLSMLEIPHPLIYGENTSKFTDVFGTDNIGKRLETYTSIILGTLASLGIQTIT